MKKNKIPRKQKKCLKKAQPLIFTCYVNVGNMPYEDVKKYMQKMMNILTPNKKMTREFIHYLIPVRDQETRIECLNPVRINGKFFDIITKQLEENQKIVDDIVKEYNKNK